MTTAKTSNRRPDLPRISTWLYPFLIVLVFGAAIPASAQTAGINGSVTDPAGAAVSDALVTAKDSATGIAHQARSTSAGLYDIFGLTPGTYTVEVSKPGFAKEVEKQVTLQVSTTTKLNFKLSVGCGRSDCGCIC